MPGRDEPRAAGDQRVRDVEVATADHAEHGLGAEVGQPLPTASRPACSAALHQGQHAAGAPDPPTIGSGPVITTAPVMGRRARFRSCVRPYLPAPSNEEWHGNGGLKECAAPASVPTVSMPSPIIGACSAIHGRTRSDSGGVRARLVGIQELGLAVGTGVPARPVQQPAALRQRPVVRFPLLDVLDLEQEVRVSGRFRTEIKHHGRGDQPRHRHIGHVLPVLAR